MIQESVGSQDLLQEESKSKKFFITTIRAENWWVEQARDNPAMFMEYITGMKTADHQIEWLYNIFGKDNSRVNIVAFPGSSKSHCLVYSLAWFIGKKPWLTNIICSVSSKQAEERLEAVRNLIDLDARYRNVFPWIQIDKRKSNNKETMNIWSMKWGMNQDTGKELDYRAWMGLITRFGEPKDDTLFAAGVTSKGVIGRRVSGFLIVDDPHDEENSHTEGQRQKIIRFFKNTLLTRLVPKPDAKAVVISTRWAETDMAGTLMNEKRGTGEPVWKTTVTPIEDEEGNPTWPEVWDKQSIEERAEELGGKESPLYQLSYLNNPMGGSSNEITVEMLRRGLPDELPEFKGVYISCDFAHTEKLQSDWTVYTAIARDTEKNFGVYVLDMKRFKKSQVEDKIQKLGEFADEIYERFGLKWICLEDKDSQAEEQALRLARPDLPIKVIKTKGDKDARFKTFAYHVQIKKVWFNQHMQGFPAMFGEVLGFPGSQHDDCVDTLSLPFQMDDWQVKRMKSTLIKAKSYYLT